MKNLNDENGCFIVIVAFFFMVTVIIVAGMMTGTLDELLKFFEK